MSDVGACQSLGVAASGLRLQELLLYTASPSPACSSFPNSTSPFSDYARTSFFYSLTR